jgi:hypothetical protein
MGNPKRFYRSGVHLHKFVPSFSCTCKRTEAKEDARVPLHPARRHGGWSARKLASLRQSARFKPSAPPMLGAGQREIEKTKNY